MSDQSSIRPEITKSDGRKNQEKGTGLQDIRKRGVRPYIRILNEYCKNITKQTKKQINQKNDPSIHHGCTHNFLDKPT
jgi:hypothetical protein